uniref:hypothetical protein n=1 Tax=Klebsiella pneumoniae TaxID=573 RepID=UPI00249278C4
KRAYCLKTQPATGETYPKSDLFNKADVSFPLGLIAADMVEITSMVQSIVNRLRTFILQK